MFGGICAFLAVVQFLVVWVAVGLMGGYFLGNMAWPAGFFIGLLTALPLYTLAEILEAVFDIAENSYKLVELAALSAKDKQPEKNQSPEKKIYEIHK